MALYPLALYTHITCAVITISFFMLRSYWMMTGSPLLHHRFVRIAPHIVDTLLLVSAIWLAVMLRQYPLAQDWLTVKVAALFAYIGLGMVALRFGRSKSVRGLAFALAIVTFAFIVSVAWYRHPAGVFALLQA